MLNPAITKALTYLNELSDWSHSYPVAESGTLSFVHRQESHNYQYSWLCLRCTAFSYPANQDTDDFSLASHQSECSGTDEAAQARHKLLLAIAVHTDHISSFGLMGPDLLRQNVWQTIAQDLGWPCGWNGQHGWLHSGEILNVVKKEGTAHV